MPKVKTGLARGPLKTLIICLNYAPELTGIAPYTSKLAEGLQAQDAAVRVLTGYPHYPQWKVHDGYVGTSMSQRLEGIRIRRLRHRIPRSPTFLARLHLELSFAVRVFNAAWNRPEVVLVATPALFSAGLAVVKARAMKIPIGVWVQDIYSRGLEETSGYSSYVTRAMKALEGAILRSATGVTVIHERFKDYVVKDLGVPAEKVRVIRNWSHIDLGEVIDREEVRRRFGWGEDEVIVLHAGNMGVKQDLGNLVETAKIAASSHSKLRFVFLGDGNQRRTLEMQAKGVPNVTFLQPLPDEGFTAVLRSADVLIVNEMPGVREMSVPSKLTSYFATGLPIVAATEPDSATADEIRSSCAGLHVVPGSPEALLRAIQRLAVNGDFAAACGASGVPYATTILSEERAISEFYDWLTSLKRATNQARSWTCSN